MDIELVKKKRTFGSVSFLSAVYQSNMSLNRTQESKMQNIMTIVATGKAWRVERTPAAFEK